MWVCIRNSFEEIHIIPHNDLIEHTESEDCVCGPQTTDLSDGQWLHTHASLDGREIKEADLKSDGS